MTAHKARKHLVRERMARTGESYTTAHRHVTARRADGIPGVTPGYPAFGATAHGPSALARHLLAQQGVEVSEALACGLGGGIGFLYAVFEYAAVPHPLVTIVAQHHPQPWLEAVTGHLGLSTTTVTSTRPAPALAKLDAVLSAGQAAQVVVARGRLPWHAGTRPEEAADPHTAVVAGHDGNAYLVDDGAAGPHRVDTETLAEAWAEHRTGRFALTTVDPPGSAPDLAAGVRAALATTHAHLTGPVLGNSFDVNLGLRGLHRLAADLADTRTRRGWARRFGDPVTLAAGTRRLAECLTWAHTAAGATRPLYAQFLAEAGPLAGLDTDAAHRAAVRAGERWTEIADVAGTAATDDPPGTIALLAGLVAEVVPLEQELAEHLGDLVAPD